MLKSVTRLLLVLFLLVAPSFSFSQSVTPSQSVACGTGTNPTDASRYWTLSSDSDVAALANATPSVPYYMDCLRITGSVSSVSALSSLNLVYVSEFYVDNTTSLQNLNGLETLTQIDSIEIFNNAALQDLSTLKNVGAINELVDVTPGSLCQSLKAPFLLYPEIENHLLFSDNRVASEYEDDNVIYGNLAIGGVNRSCWDNAQAPAAERESLIRRIFEGQLAVQNTTTIGDNRERFTVGKGSIQVAAMSILPNCKFTDITIEDTDFPGGLLEINFGLHDCRNYADPEDDPEPVIVIYDFGEDLPAGTELGKVKNGEFKKVQQSLIAGPYLAYKLWDDYEAYNGGYRTGDFIRGCAANDETYEDPTDGVQKLLPAEEICIGADALDEDDRHGYIRDPLILRRQEDIVTQQQPVPALPLFGLLTLGGLLGLLGLGRSNAIAKNTE